MNKVRIGIIGMGRMGLTHYSIINTHPAVEITAVADTSSTMLNMLKKYIPNLKVYTDYQDMLNDGVVDGIIVCTPSFLHHPVCKMACEKGVNVFCEKPFTTDPKLANELADMFEAKGLVNQVGYVNRYNPVFRTVKEFISEGVLGEISTVNTQFLSATIIKSQPEKGWRAKRENGGGATYEMASHAIDLMEYLLGKPESVIGSSLKSMYSENVEDICDAVVSYNGGVNVNLHVNWSEYTYRKPMMKLDIVGTKGKVQADFYGYQVYLREENKGKGLSEGWTIVPKNMIPETTPFYVRGTNFSNQLYEFADAILEGKKIRGCSFREAADTQELIHTFFNNDKK